MICRRQINSRRRYHRSNNITSNKIKAFITPLHVWTRSSPKTFRIAISPSSNLNTTSSSKCYSKKPNRQGSWRKPSSRNKGSWLQRCVACYSTGFARSPQITAWKGRPFIWLCNTSMLIFRDATSIYRRKTFSWLALLAFTWQPSARRYIHRTSSLLRKAQTTQLP